MQQADAYAARHTHPVPLVGVAPTTPSAASAGVSAPHRFAAGSGGAATRAASTHFIAQVYFDFPAASALELGPAKALRAQLLPRPFRRRDASGAAASHADGGEACDEGCDDDEELAAELPGVIVRVPAAASARELVDLALSRLVQEAELAADTSLPDAPALLPGPAGNRARALATLEPPSVFLEDFSLHMARADGTGILYPPHGGGYGSLPHHDQQQLQQSQRPGSRPMSAASASAAAASLPLATEPTMAPAAPSHRHEREQPRPLPPSPFTHVGQVVLQTPFVTFPYAFVVASRGVDYAAVTAAAARGAKATMLPGGMDPAVALVQPGRTRLAHLASFKESAHSRVVRVMRPPPRQPAAKSPSRRVRSPAKAAKPASPQDGSRGAAASPPGRPDTGSTIARESQSASTAPAAAVGTGTSRADVFRNRLPSWVAAARPGASVNLGGLTGSMSLPGSPGTALGRAQFGASSIVGTAGPSREGFSGGGPGAGRVSRRHLPELLVADDEIIMDEIGLSAYDVARHGEGYEARAALELCVEAGAVLEQQEVDRRRAERNAAIARRRKAEDTGRAAESRDAVARIAATQQERRAESTRRQQRATLDEARERAERDVAAAARSHAAASAEAAARDAARHEVDEQRAAAAAAEQQRREQAQLQRQAERTAAASARLEASVAAKARARDESLHPVPRFAGPMLAALHAGNAARSISDEAALRRRELLSGAQSALETSCAQERSEANALAAEGVVQRHERAHIREQRDAVRDAEGRRAGARRVERTARQEEAARLAALHASRSWAQHAESRR